MKKTCTKCHIEKELDDFAKAKRYAMGRKSWCRECVKEYQSKYHSNGYDTAYKKDNREHLTKIAKEWYEKTDRYNTYHKKYVKAYKKEHPLLVIFRHVKSQCNNPNHSSYHNFGAKGIGLCKAWQADGGFKKFEKWAYESGGYENGKGLVISRKSNKRDFSPGNCLFITHQENCRDRLNGNATYKYLGETKCLSAWAEDKRCVVKLGTLSNRIHAYGWKFDEALTTPAMNRRKNVCRKSKWR